jgi:hypothetical protein
MQTSWTQTEEARIIQTMEQDSTDRLEAIRRLRSAWLIGETAPPMSRPGRKMPRENPRYGQTVGDAVQDRANAPARPSFLGAEASTGSGTRLDPKRLHVTARKPASERQARWRAKRAGQRATLSLTEAA